MTHISAHISACLTFACTQTCTVSQSVSLVVRAVLADLFQATESNPILPFTFWLKSQLQKLRVLLECDRVTCRYQPSHLVLQYLSVPKLQRNNTRPLSRARLSHFTTMPSTAVLNPAFSFHLHSLPCAASQIKTWSVLLSRWYFNTAISFLCRLSTTLDCYHVHNHIEQSLLLVNSAVVILSLF